MPAQESDHTSSNRISRCTGHQVPASKGWKGATTSLKKKILNKNKTVIIQICCYTMLNFFFENNTYISSK